MIFDLDENWKILVILLVVILGIGALFVLGGLKVPGVPFSTAVIQSISQTTYNGQPVTLVNLLGASGGQTLAGYLTSNNFGYNGTPTILVVNRVNASYLYSAIQRTGPTAAIYSWQLQNSCNGYSGLLGSCQNWYQGGLTLGAGFTAFQQQCLAINSTAIAYDAGTGPSLQYPLGNPKWRCYVPSATWIVSDFSRTSGQYLEGISISINENYTGNNQVGWAVLTNSMQSAPILSTSDVQVGQASMSSLVSSFLTPPPSSGISAIRPASAGSATLSPFSNGFSYYVVDGSLGQAVSQAQNQFTLCQSQAALQATQIGNTGSYNDASLQACVANYNSAISNLQNLAPTGNFVGLNTTTMNSAGTVSLPDQFAFPNINLILYNSFIGVTGISQSIAVPASLSCQPVSATGGTLGAISCTITNGPVPGNIPYSVNCPAPITVQNGSGQLYLQANGHGSFTVSALAPTTAMQNQCSIFAQSSNLNTSISSSFSFTSSNICQLTPPYGSNLWVNMTSCTLYCAIQLSQCAGNLNTTSCVCNGAPPSTCNPPNVFNAAGQCVPGPQPPPPPQPPQPNITACFPLFQQLDQQTTGGFNLFGVNFGGTQVSTCDWNYTGIGGILAVIGLVIALYGVKSEEEDYRNIGLLLLIAGLMLVGLAFAGANTGLLILLGLLAVVAIMGFVVFKILA